MNKTYAIVYTEILEAIVWRTTDVGVVLWLAEAEWVVVAVGVRRWRWAETGE